jgi:hypothetical protein
MHRVFAVSVVDLVRSTGQESRCKEAKMKIPVVRETRRAGQSPIDQHRRQVALVTRSLMSLPERRAGWDERTRTEFRRVA